MRTERDWKEVTTPVALSAIVPDEMPDYSGTARAAIRAFMKSTSAVATVPNVQAGVAQGVIEGLGLIDEIFAEQRDGVTVLRRVSPKVDLLPIRGRASA